MRNGASDALSRGGPISFDHALRLYRLQIAQELDQQYDDEEVDEECVRFARELREAADIAESVYLHAIEQVASELRLHPNPYVEILGEANERMCEHGNWHTVQRRGSGACGDAP